MGLFGASSIYDVDVEKATSEKNTSEKWDLILEICDKVGSSSNNAKECLKSIMKRLNHNDPHVVVQAITLLDACVNNCGKNFHLEVASRDFETEFKRLIIKNQTPEVNMKLKLCLKRWAEGDFKTDSQLNLIPSLYQKLKSEGHDFSEPHQPKKHEAPLPKDPNVVSSQQEEDDIAKAIELSLKEAKTASPKNQARSSAGTTGNSTSSSLYPSMSLSGAGGGGGALAPGTGTQLAVAAPEPRKVRALYDFEAAEDNELTFCAGEILMVLDDTDQNWWKGSNQRGEGLFPSNFVTADLSAEPETATKMKKSYEDELLNNKLNEAREEEDTAPAAINEDNIDRLLHLLNEADPEDPSQDTDEMLRLEAQVNHMGPLIDAELERVDRRHAQLSQLSADLVDAINLYHQLMRDDRPISTPYSMYNAAPVPTPPASMFNPHAIPPNSMYSMPPMMNYYGPTSLPAQYAAAPGFVPQQMQNGQHVVNGHQFTPQQGQQQPLSPPPVSHQAPSAVTSTPMPGANFPPGMNFSHHQHQQQFMPAPNQQQILNNHQQQQQQPSQQHGSQQVHASPGHPHVHHFGSAAAVAFAAVSGVSPQMTTTSNPGQQTMLPPTMNATATSIPGQHMQNSPNHNIPIYQQQR